ncbi:MAG: CocE/NonD family hydrolase, partial [Candidatus Sericytochromatia bacterium]
MKGLAIFLGAVALADLASCLPTAVSVDVLARRLDARPAAFAVASETDQRYLAKDGTTLSADVYHPRGAGPFPTILVRLPLSRSRQHQTFADLLGHFWAGRGYHVVIAGLRGRFRSQGAYEPLTHERADGLATLAWLERQAWFDGRLGMWGGSVFGYTQWVLADQRDPGPRALFMQIVSSDHHGMFYPGGAFSLQTALYWAMTDRGDHDAFPTAEEMAPGFAGFPVVEADDRTGRALPVFDAWTTHRRRDAFWRAIDGHDRPERLEAPALLLAGWYDPYLPTQLADYTRIKAGARPEVAAKTRLIIGPWSHAREVTLPGGVNPGDYRFESIGPSLPFYDDLLRPPGAPAPAPQPAMRIFVMGENRWRDEAAWPLARARETAFYLRGEGKANTLEGDGALSTEAPHGDEPEDFFVYDPLNPVPSAGGVSLSLPGGNGVQLQNAVEA